MSWLRRRPRLATTPSMDLWVTPLTVAGEAYATGVAEVRPLGRPGWVRYQAAFPVVGRRVFRTLRLRWLGIECDVNIDGGREVTVRDGTLTVIGELQFGLEPAGPSPLAALTDGRDR